MRKNGPLRKKDPLRCCGLCHKVMERQRYAGDRLEGMGRFLQRKYCSRKCQNAALVKPEVTKGQYRFRARPFLKESCDFCLGQRNLQIHHKDRNIKNNDLANLATLCASCHNKLHWKNRRANGP